MTFKRGDIVLAIFPNSDLRTAKRRPVAIVQADQLGTGLNQTIVAMITSNSARANHPSRLIIRIATPQGQQTGLHTDSVIMTDNLETILDSEIDRVIGSWPDVAALDVALRHTLGL
jgi:mRNA interferase MazF